MGIPLNHQDFSDKIYLDVFYRDRQILPVETDDYKGEMTMRSLRTKITVTMLCVILVSLVFTTLLSAVFTRRTERSKTEQLLLMLCSSGERSLDYYFDNVASSVLKVTSFAEENLEGLSDEQLERNIEEVRKYFEMMSKTKGVLTYYYRIDPAVSSSVKGFWYTDTTGNGFQEHEVTDITLYDTEDTSKLVWFTVPKHEGKPIWLPPYITDNLDVRVISYDAPVYCKGQFVGVIGIEVDYSTMAEEVDSLRIYKNGYAFLSDSEGNLFYHPRIDVTDPSVDTTSEIPEDAIGERTFIWYTYKGEKKEAAWLPLSNGMRLNVTVPVSEMEGDWQGLIINIAKGAAFVLCVASLFLLYYTRRISQPLEQLTEASEQVGKGYYDLFLPYDRDDELGRLTRTFKSLSDQVREHISDLNEQVFVDALTDVKNKGAFEKALKELQEQIDNGSEQMEFAIGVFDCDNLKIVNDQYGHDKGDAYLKKAGRTIGNVFKHSPVFRIGGDEFTVILKNEDYRNMDLLLARFSETAEEINASVDEPWEKVKLSKGFAVYDSSDDGTVTDVTRRADKLMYEDKRNRKVGR